MGELEDACWIPLLVWTVLRTRGGDVSDTVTQHVLGRRRHLLDECPQAGHEQQARAGTVERVLLR